MCYSIRRLPGETLFYIRFFVPGLGLVDTHLLPKPFQKHIIINFVKLLAEYELTILQLVSQAYLDKAIYCFYFDPGVLVHELVGYFGQHQVQIRDNGVG